jgi:hypothetical protein
LLLEHEIADLHDREALATQPDGKISAVSPRPDCR